jgi:hypothetical protein
LDKTKDSLFLGESKIHGTGETGVKELIKDIKTHFNTDFLEGEFILVGNKKRAFLPLQEYNDKTTKEEYKLYLEKKNHWFDKLDEIQSGKSKLKSLFDSVTVPMLCTYTSKVILSHKNETTDAFKIEYLTEIRKLEKIFDEELKKLKQTSAKGQPIKGNLNIILMLFPVPDKKELVKRLHLKLHETQIA